MAGEKVSPGKNPSVKVFNCPSCGGSVTLRAMGQSVSAVCGSCLAVIDASNENFRLIQKATDAKKRDPLIPLGQRGKLKGVLWETIGYMERIDDSGVYVWSEYLLFNPLKGFRWLMEFNGHWNYLLMTKEQPKLGTGVRVEDYTRKVAKYLNNSYYLFHKGTAKVIYVEGEFYWRVERGETVQVLDYVRPPEILSCESSRGETIWSIGEYVSASAIKTAFQIEKPMPVQTGVAPNQASPSGEAAATAKKIWIGFLVALIGMQMINIILSRGEVVYKGQFLFQANDTERIRVSPPFPLKHGLSNLEVEVSAGVQNNWLEVQSDLVNDDNGQTYEFGQGIEYYSGQDSDGSWTEGSQFSSTTLSTIPEGNYHLNLDVSGPGLPELAAPAPTGIDAVITPVSAVMRTENWPNGKVRSQEPIVDGKIEGLAKYFHENGELQSEVPFLHGLKHGRVKTFRPDGVIEQDANYRNGQLDGATKLFGPTGDLDSVRSYQDGKEVFTINSTASKAPAVTLGVTVRRGVVTWSNFFWALVLISLYPVVVWWRNRRFEMERWSQSDYSPFPAHKDG